MKTYTKEELLKAQTEYYRLAIEAENGDPEKRFRNDWKTQPPEESAKEVIDFLLSLID